LRATGSALCSIASYESKPEMNHTSCGPVMVCAAR
jgi:hypothetical protein